MRDDPLLQPFRLRHLTLKNRVMSTAHEPAYSENGLPGERYRLYHAEKAKGGIALTMTAGSAVVSPDSPPAFGNLTAYKDEIVRPLSEMVEACHEHGCAVMIQLTHIGRRTGYAGGDWLPVIAPSALREPAHRSHPKAMEDWDIDRVVRDWAAAAERMKAAGLDGIEIESYGHLMDAFWSPAWNLREDDWGGSLDNRLRFTWAVIDAIREAVGPEFITGIRMVADENMDGGLSREEGIEIARRLASSGKIDFLNLIRGHIDHDAALNEVIPIAGMRSAPHLDFAGEVRAATRFPVFHAAAISDVATARHAIAEGKLDMVGMTRAHMADPHIVAKIMRGEEARIRPCTGATYCLDRIYEAGEALCIHNAATGREARMPHVIPKAPSRRRAVVVGAGPAGLEAARVLAERGHDVTVLEAASRPGGQVLLATRNPLRRDLIGIVDWRVAELERLGTRIECDLYAEAEDVLARDPDIVVIATGGLPQTPPMPGGGAELCHSSWDVLSGELRPEGKVLVYDDHGGHQALSAAKLLAEGGAEVEIVTPERMFGIDMGGMNHVPYARAFQCTDTRITLHTVLTGVRRDGNALVARLGSRHAPGWSEERRVDRVVVEYGTAPLDELYFALRSHSGNRGALDHAALLAGRDPYSHIHEGFVLLRIGDAVASRNIHAAIYDGLRMCLPL
ncbi:MAG: oxidoreductase [Limimaricola soesokkakensis]|uniref:oxidoreductase n=1 Tax=Limimaricola soesokkakensis TaxID=1343159 RepID=UPI00405A04B7